MLETVLIGEYKKRRTATGHGHRRKLNGADGTNNFEHFDTIAIEYNKRLDLHQLSRD